MLEGDETFDVTITNASTTGTTTPLTITSATTEVTILNDDTPVATADGPEVVAEGGVLVVNGVLDDDDLAFNFTRTAVLTRDVVHGALNLSSTGAFTYDLTGDADFNGADFFEYKAVYDDGAGRTLESAPVSSTITVTPLNDSPVAGDDFYAVIPKQVLNVDVGQGLLANDSDVDTGDNITVDVATVVFTPAGAPVASSLTVNADGSFTYDPGDLVGGQTFTYQTEDDSGAGNDHSNVATVTLSQGPTFEMSVETALPVDEDSSIIAVKITLNNATALNSSVQFQTQDTGTGVGFATAGTDYTAVNQTVTLNNQTTSTTINITILNDAAATAKRYEGLEAFQATLSNQTTTGTTTVTSIKAPTAVALTIDDPQDLPSLSIDSVSVDETAGVATLTVTQTGLSVRTTTARYDTQNDGTVPAGRRATANVDYQAVANGTVTISPNSLTAQINININDDRRVEPDETFGVDLSNPVNASIAATPGIVTIIDDDLRIKVSIGDTMVVEGGVATLDITQDLEGSEDVNIDYQTWDGTANAPGDYTAKNGTATITAGTTSTQITVTTINDGDEEDYETIIVLLSNASTTGDIGADIDDKTGLITVKDNEPAIKVVTVTSDGEAMPGDQYFIAVTTGPGTGMTPIANVSDIVKWKYDLAEVRSKPTTHVLEGRVASTTLQGTMTWNNVGGSGLNASLRIVGMRSNRNFYLWPGTNFMGLGLQPRAREDKLTISLRQENDSGQRGWATLMANDTDAEKTDVAVYISPGSMVSGPIHIHTGQCGTTLGGVAYALTNVVGGISITTVDVALEDLQDGNHAINLHDILSPGIYTACGNIHAPDSIAGMLDQSVPNAHPDFIAALKANRPNNIAVDRNVVKVWNVLEAVYAFDGTITDANAGADPWLKYFPTVPFSGVDPADTAGFRRGILKKCVNSQAVYPLSEQHGLKARERRYTAHEEGKHWE